MEVEKAQLNLKKNDKVIIKKLSEPKIRQIYKKHRDSFNSYKTYLKNMKPYFNRVCTIYRILSNGRIHVNEIFPYYIYPEELEKIDTLEYKLKILSELREK
jgi:hypothetical protein